MTERLVKFADDGQDLTLLPLTTVTTDELQPGTYTFAYHQMKGTWLTHCARIPDVEMKVYGSTNYRVKKSIDAFKRRPHNTGVLLEGEPGMGKSVFIKLIAAEAYKMNMPVIVIKEDLPGMVDILSKIHTECLVIMDEFEKIFSGDNDSARNGDVSSQNKLLSLMDGMDAHKKLFIASVNDSWRVSRFLKNRPGRFFYNFTFANLNQQQILEYLEDRLVDKEKVIPLLTSLVGHSVNYDALAAISEEINAGLPIEETLSDLNLDKNATHKYDVRLSINDEIWSCDDFTLNCENDEQYVWLRRHGSDGFTEIRVNFNIEKIKLRGNNSWDEILIVPYDEYIIDENQEQLPDIKSRSDLEFAPHKEFNGYRTFGRLEV